LKTLRRLILAKSPDGHLCLFPVEDKPENVLSLPRTESFTCACGAVFEATLTLSSWTTEYTPRCLNGFRANGEVS